MTTDVSVVEILEPIHNIDCPFRVRSGNLLRVRFGTIKRLQDLKMPLFFPFIFNVFVMASVSHAMSYADYSSVIPAERICKPGPPLKATTGKINCLIIGDSISIG